jgi:hypothetical protein
MKRCKTCKYWDERDKPPRHCLSPKFRYVSQFRQGALDSFDELKDAELGYADECADNAEVVTGPEFGCVHHAEREA